MITYNEIIDIMFHTNYCLNGCPFSSTIIDYEPFCMICIHDISYDMFVVSLNLVYSI